VHFSTDDADVLDLLQDTSGTMVESALIERSVCCFENPVYMCLVFCVRALCGSCLQCHCCNAC